MLFGDYSRTNASYKHYKETDFEFYNRSADELFTCCRNLLNKWFSEYPEHEKNDLKGRFNSDFDSAFFELFLFRLFKRSGFELTPHPAIENQSTKPDYLLDKGFLSFYLEAKVVNDMTEAEKKEQAFNELFYHELNKVKSPNFFLSIDELEFKRPIQPSLKDLRRYVEDELAKRDPDEIEAVIRTEGFRNDQSEIVYENSDFRIGMHLFPKLKQFRGDTSGRPIGVIATGAAKFVNTHESIKTSLQKKANRYGAFNKPFVIALNSLSPYGVDDFTIFQALFGDLNFVLNKENPEQEMGSYRSRNGAFHHHYMRNVSAVFLTRAFPMNMEEAGYSFYINPNATNPIDLLNNDFNVHYFDETGKLQFKQGKAIKEIVS